MLRYLGVIAACLAGMCSPGCLEQKIEARERMRAPLTEKLWKIPMAAQFRELFPTEETYIHYINGGGRVPEFQATAYLHGRYILRLSVEFEFDRDTLELVAPGSPSVFLEEITKVTDPSDGTLHLEHGISRKVDFAAWHKVYAAKGDFAAIGLEIKTHSPVEGFDKITKRSIRK